jgi:hypothetical protein
MHYRWALTKCQSTNHYPVLDVMISGCRFVLESKVEYETYTRRIKFVGNLVSDPGPDVCWNARGKLLPLTTVSAVY